MPPQRPDLVLAADVPDVKLDVLVGDGLDVEADGGDGSDVLAELELVEDGRLAGGVEAEHEEAHLLGSEDLAHHLGQLAAHGGWSGWGGRLGCGECLYVSGSVGRSRGTTRVLVSGCLGRA